MRKNKLYPTIEEEKESSSAVCEPVATLAKSEILLPPDDVDYAHIVNGTLQITPDIEEEISEVDKGETVSMSEFKTMFSKWL